MYIILVKYCINARRYSFDEDTEILVNGVKADDNVAYKSRSEFGIKIKIPDIELKRSEKRSLIREIINKILTLFR